jgi:hypothetical protein
VLPLPAGSSGAAIAYEQAAGRAFGELDPKLPGNAIIQDIELAKDADGKVRYVATFLIKKPVDMSRASGPEDAAALIAAAEKSAVLR